MKEQKVARLLSLIVHPFKLIYPSFVDKMWFT